MHTLLQSETEEWGNGRGTVVPGATCGRGPRHRERAAREGVRGEALWPWLQAGDPGRGSSFRSRLQAPLCFVPVLQQLWYACCCLVISPSLTLPYRFSFLGRPSVGFCPLLWVEHEVSRNFWDKWGNNKNRNGIRRISRIVRCCGKNEARKLES